MDKSSMLEAFRRAVPRTRRRGLFFLHIAVVLVAMARLRGESWNAALVRAILVAITFVALFVFETYNEKQAISGKPRLDSGQLWKRFFVVCAVLSVIYIGVAVGLAVLAGNPDGLQELFPIYFLTLACCSVVLFWEFKHLSDGGGDTST
ncbi:hypothetical protein [Paraburkholderia sp. JPY419]|uniref:hypothetical protein n=1 Tax=Paraburkholderia sp. JPY419 TaxID=667660 RepID=UPI003D256307